MNRFRIYLAATCMASLLLAFTACKKEKDLTISNEKELTQTAYADEENTGKGFTFTAKSDWTASVKEAGTQKSGSDVAWWKLLYKGVETYSGGAGTFTLEISIELNYTGKTRSATIEIVCGNDKITITVTQSGTTEEGEVPEASDFILDLSGAIPTSGEIVVVRALSSNLVILATANAETGFKMELPEIVSDNYLMYVDDFIQNAGESFTGISVSDQSAKTNSFLFWGYANGNAPVDEPVGEFHWRDDDISTFTIYMYFDKDCNFLGDKCNCYFKKGWNIMYINYANGTRSTTKPVGNFKWVYVD